MRVTIFDYGAGNLHSIAKALAACGTIPRVEPDLRAALATDLLVLPGVGAFAPAAARLHGARDALHDAIASGLACLGVCLGMQLMFSSSEEGNGKGLGLFKGTVTRLDARRVPHLGWSALERGDAPIGVLPRYAYFAHSYACRDPRCEDVAAWASLDGVRFAAAVRRDRVLGVQFHPEKSSREGLAMIRAFVEETMS